MLETIGEALLPMVDTLLLGFLAAWRGDFGPKDAAILNRMVLNYAVPMMLFAGTVSRGDWTPRGCQSVSSPPPSDSFSRISSAKVLAPSAGPSAREPCRPGWRTARGTRRAACHKQRPYLFAVDLGVRLNRAALRAGLQRRDLGPELRAQRRAVAMEPDWPRIQWAAIRISRSALGWITT